MRKGSISLFSVLVLLLVSSFLFALLEGARREEIKRISALQTELALENAFASYNSFLWENYHLLLREKTGLEEEILKTGNGRGASGKGSLNLLQAEVEGVELLGYTLLTDGKGKAYIQAISSYMEKNLLYETAQMSYNYFEVMKTLKDGSFMDLANVERALKSLESKETALPEEESPKVRAESVKNSVSSEPPKFFSNPLEEIKKIQKMGILELVLQDTSQVSGRSISPTERLSYRTLETGKNSKISETDLWDKLLVQQHILTYFSNFIEEKENRALTYEVEYILGGKEQDVENLKQVATELLELRCISNFLYLSSDAAKKEEALGVALLLAGASANPGVIEAVKIGILTVWALGEGVLDLRGIFAGKKIPLLKSSETWTLSLDELGNITEGFPMAKESSVGLSYKDYLGILLLFQEESKLAFRAMDVQEQALKNQFPERSFLMDHFFLQTEIEVRYRYYPLFLPFISKSVILPWQYEFSTKAEYSY